MKKLLFLIGIMLMAIPAAYSHGSGSENKEKMRKEVKEFKMKYLAKEMELTEEQKGKFFELYEEMSQKRKACYKQAHEMEKRLRKDEKEATEADYQQVTEAFNKANIETAEIEKSYNEKFAEFLTPKQIYKLKDAERSFHERLEEMKHNRKKERK